MEMLIYLGVMVGLVAVITNIFLVLGRGRGTVIAQGEVHRSMRFAAERIGQDLRSATSVTTPSLTGDVNSTATLVLAHPDDGTVTFCVVADVLLRATSGAACDGNAAALTPAAVVAAAPVFTRWENTNSDLMVTVVSIEFDLSMDYNSMSPDFQYSESKTTTVALRP